MSLITLAENFKIVQGSAIATTSGGITGDYISLKNVHRATVVFHLLQAAAHATGASIMKATAVAPTGATAMVATVPIWENEDTAASDALVKQTDAASVTLAADVKNKIVVMQIDPVRLGETYDCIAGKLSDSSESTNFAAIMYFLEMRYAQATPPTAITD